jgi:hypothetical protein
MVIRAAGVAVALVILTLSGCGRQDDPLPPLIRKADTTRDLAVFQEGQEAVLTWSYPSITTAGGPLPDVEAVEVWRATIPAGQEPPDLPGRDRVVRYQLLAAQGVLLAAMDDEAIDGATRGPMLELRDDLVQWRSRYGTEERWVIWYSVRTICCRRRPSDFSNIARLVPELPPPPPRGLRALPVVNGITLTWRPQQDIATIVERSEAGDEWLALTAEPVEGTSWQDTGAEQGRSWSYRVRAVRSTEDGGRVVGDPSEMVTVDYPDLYPPPAPANLVCLPEATVVRVRWQASPDDAWYMVTRLVNGGGRQRLGTRHRQPQFEDSEPPIGSLTYEVRAVDGVGNRSDAATCTTVIGAPP